MISIQRGKLRSYGLILAILIIYCGIMSLSLTNRITDDSLSDDSYNNLQTAYNLAYYSVFSDNASVNGHGDDLQPTNYREPLPIAFMALHIQLQPELASNQTIETLNEGGNLVLMKRHNLIWTFACLLGMAIAVLVMFSGRIKGWLVAFVSLLFLYWFFLQSPTSINRLTTEVQAATFVVWNALALILALKTKYLFWWGLTGILAGCLALTKAIFWYVGIGLGIALLIIYLLKPPLDWTRRQVLIRVIALALGLALIVTPWMFRNYTTLGSFEITERGGVVLLMRAYKNQMDIAGGFYAYAPAGFQSLVGSLLGFSPQDLEIGGRIPTLNRSSNSSFVERDRQAELMGKPEDAISFYRQARAERVRLVQWYQDQGFPNASSLADVQMQREAMQLILADPLRHLATTVVFMWRGVWSIQIPQDSNLPNGFVNLLALLINALGLIALGVMFVLGLIHRHPVWLGLTLVSVGGLLLYALTSHFIPRYSEPMLPIMLLSFVLGLFWAVEAGFKFYSRIRFRRR